jgi:putative DNA primase/helicase
MPNDAATILDGLRARTRTSAAENELITEGTVSDAFTREHRDRLRYCHDTGKWFLWDGAIWRRERTKLAYRWAHQRAKALATDTDNAKAIISAGKA